MPTAVLGAKAVKAAAAVTPAKATTAKTEVKKSTTKKTKLKPWRGSQFVWANTVAARSFAVGSELTYNPKFSMIFSFKPRWWFNKIFYLRAELSVTQELTHSDVVTYEGEAWLSDLLLVAHATNFYVIPKAKIAISAELGLAFPTSKASQGATLALAIGPGFRLSRMFKKVLKGLGFGFNFRATPYIHKYTTGTRASPLITNCSPNDPACGAFLNTGGRNAQVRLTTVLDASLQVVKQFGFSLSYGWMIDWLHPASGGEDLISNVPQDPENRRYYSYLALSAVYDPIQALSVSLTYQTYAPQLAPDSTYYNPIFNRFTTISLGLTLKVDGLIAMLGGK